MRSLGIINAEDTKSYTIPTKNFRLEDFVGLETTLKHVVLKVLSRQLFSIFSIAYT